MRAMPPSNSAAVKAKTMNRNAFEKWLKAQHAKQTMSGSGQAVPAADEAAIADAQANVQEEDKNPAVVTEKFVNKALDPANVLNFVMLNFIANDDFHTGINKGHLAKNDLVIWLQKQHHHDQQAAEAKATTIINRLRTNGAVTDNGTIDINKINPYQLQTPGEADKDYQKRIIDARWNLSIISLNT